MRSRLVLFSIVFVAVTLTGAFVTGFFLPRQWQASAQATVRATPAAIHPLVNDPRRWPEWFPWSKVKAPDIRYSYSGAETGVGAVLSWTSTNVGQGTLTLTSSDPATGVTYDLVIGGFNSLPIRGSIAFQEAGGVTTVTLQEGGELDVNPIARLFRGVIEGKLEHELNGALERLSALAEGRTPPVEPPPR
ncbi:MAG: SRPBCC family protein [Planctomycetes bacterium]|nr:SRPBCC family protein [Planctomycetota bacterium]